MKTKRRTRARLTEWQAPSATARNSQIVVEISDPATAAIIAMAIARGLTGGAWDAEALYRTGSWWADRPGNRSC